MAALISRRADDNLKRRSRFPEVDHDPPPLNRHHDFHRVRLCSRPRTRSTAPPGKDRAGRTAASRSFRPTRRRRSTFVTAASRRPTPGGRSSRGRSRAKRPSSRRAAASYKTGERIEQVVYLFGGRSPIKLEGIVRGGAESFACEADRRDRRGAGPLVVRHVSGRSRSLLNRAVYDRSADWVLSVDAGPAVTVRRPADGEADVLSAWRAEGSEIVLRFRPRFYQQAPRPGLLRALDLQALAVVRGRLDLLVRLLRPTSPRRTSSRRRRSSPKP